MSEQGFQFVDILNALQWRYATKKFNTTQKLTDLEVLNLMEATRLAPSSFGLQPWKFIVISSEGVRGQLFPHSYGNRQVLECSHLVVLCSKLDVDEKYIDNFFQHYESQVKETTFNLRRYEKQMKDFILNLDPIKNQNWISQQVHIALGFLLSAAAALRIDACPMGGFDPNMYDEILNLKEKRLTTTVTCALGRRASDDKYANAQKFRFSDREIIEYIE